MTKKAAAYVLDASAVLAWLYGEPGAGRVEAVIEASHISTVNLAEVLSKVAERGGRARQARLDLQSYGLRVHDFSPEQADDCAELRPLTRARGLSLGDRACLALSRTLRLPVLTADQAWDSVQVGVTVDLLR